MNEISQEQLNMWSGNLAIIEIQAEQLCEQRSNLQHSSTPDYTTI